MSMFVRVLSTVFVVLGFASPALAQDMTTNQVDNTIVDPDAFLADMELRDGPATCHFTNEPSDQAQEQFCEVNEGSVQKENSVFYLNEACDGVINLEELFHGVNRETGDPVTFQIWYLYKTSFDEAWISSTRPIKLSGVCEGIFYLVDVDPIRM